MSGVAFITTNDVGHTDAALVERFRQALTERERTAVFADVVRHHGEAVLGCCAERLWPDADAAVAAAADVLIAARLAMADSAKLARPDRLRDWLLGIAVCDGLPAGIDDIDWEAVQAHDASSSPAGRPSLWPWLEQIVATLPEARQRLYDLFVSRGLDSRNAARELGTDVAGVGRLRRENRQAILRAFEITALVALVASEPALDPPGSEAPGCGELRQILADAQRDGEEGLRRHTVVLPAALRLTVTRHVSQCGTCQDRRDDRMARWAPELLPILAGTELSDQVMEVLNPGPEPAQAHAGTGVHRLLRPTPAARRGTAAAGRAGAVVARAAAAAAGAGLLAALLLLGFVWPGFFHGAAAFTPRASSTPSSQDSSGRLNSSGAPQMIGTYAGVPGHGRPVPRGTAGLLGSLPAVPNGSWTAPTSVSASATPPLVYTIQPSASPTSVTSSPPQPTSGPSPISSSPAPSPSPSATKPTPVPTTSPTSPAPSTPPPTTPPPSPSASASSTPSPLASASSAAPSSTPTPSTSATS
jgi:hypothetical protein